MKNLYNIVAALIIGISMPRTFDFVYNLSDATNGAELLGNCIVIAIAFALPCIAAAIVVGILKFVEFIVCAFIDAVIATVNLIKTNKEA